MSVLVQFERSEKAMALLTAGKALMVQVEFRNNETYSDMKHVLAQLGYDTGRDFYPATILFGIGNMPGHYVVAANNKIVCGLHGDIFYIDEEDFVTDGDDVV
jgi:hypothetical protein